MDLKKLSEAEKKVGGKFKLSTLMQKRLVELMRGSPKLVNSGITNPHEIVVEEILQGKIELGEPQPEEKAKVEEGEAPLVPAP